MVQRKDLVDISDNNYDQRQGEYMLCQDCGENLGGGTRGDYFTTSMDHVFKCPNPKCRRKNIALVKDITTTEIIKI